MADEEKRIKVALITGITGQDGSYLAELLLSKGYEVRNVSNVKTPRVLLSSAASLKTVDQKMMLPLIDVSFDHCFPPLS